MYCFRHADEWNAFECESDSSDEELDLKKINNLKNETNANKVSINPSFKN